MKPLVVIIRFAGITCLVCGLASLIWLLCERGHGYEGPLALMLSNLGVGWIFILMVGFSERWINPSLPLVSRRKREAETPKRKMRFFAIYVAEGVFLGLAIAAFWYWFWFELM